MSQTTLKIALAGLMHDIGKFAQGCLPVTKDYIERNAGQYQPFRDGHHTHIHTIYTAAFIEQMEDKLPLVLNGPGWGKGDSFINLAAGHHNPETAMQWIVSMADRISSGLDRVSFEKGEKIAFRDFKKTRLLPVLESLGPERADKFKSQDDYHYEYQLAPITAKNIFPQKKSVLSQDEAKEEYRRLFDAFVNDLSLLHHKDDVELWSQHFESLLMIYTSTIPAARVGDVVYDISLYDHCRTTAAIAGALYRFHEITDSLDKKSICNSDTEKFLLIGGDFYGIQDFIFASHGEKRALRSKLLRGRSFAVSLLSELAAKYICDQLALPFLCVLLNAAGKFHIIAPNTEATIETLGKCEQEINDWLFKHTFGESSLGISYTKASHSDFYSGKFKALWDRHLQNVESRKYQKVDLNRHGGTVEGYFDSFNNEIDSGNRLCPLCGKRASNIRTLNDPVFGRSEVRVSCTFCRDHVFLGGNLVKAKFVAIARHKATSGSYGNLDEPIFGNYQVFFPKDDLQDMANSENLLALWQIGINDDGTIPIGATVKLINGHVPWFRESDNQDQCILESSKSDGKLDEMIGQIESGAIKTFSHIALMARHWDPIKKTCLGIEALGVLKADVDHLGMLFGCGLPDDRFTVSRLATVSRQLNNFFALYLPHELATSERFFDVYTVFAGGDDLFLIGPWNKMGDLALILRKRFCDFSCENPRLTFSAGISVHKPNTPVDRMAEASENALEEAKKQGRNRITMFGQTMIWDDFDTVMDFRNQMRTWLAENYVSDAMFYRFNYFVQMAEEEKELSKKETISMDELSCLKWPALFQYNIARNVTKEKTIHQKAMDEVGQAFEWIKKYRGGIRIPLWHVLYEKRK